MYGMTITSVTLTRYHDHVAVAEATVAPERAVQMLRNAGQHDDAALLQYAILHVENRHRRLER